MWTTLNFRDRGKLKKKRLEIFMYIRTLYIEFERDWSIGLGHGCAKVAHCVTARWRNFSHYCRPVCHYDVWLCVLITAKHRQARWQHTVYRNKRLEFATEQVGKLRYVTAVDGGLKRFSWVAWFAHPWVRWMMSEVKVLLQIIVRILFYEVQYIGGRNTIHFVASRVVVVIWINTF